jgi:hypothetical protein
MNLLQLISLLLLALGLVSCGKYEESNKYSSQKSGTHSLETGSTFLNAPYNWIDFGAISKNKSFSKTLIFTARHDGTLSVGLNTYGRGQSCDSLENAYTITSTFKLKRFSDQEYKVVDRPNTMVPTFELKEGDSLIVDLLLISYLNCSHAEINIFATF